MKSQVAPGLIAPGLVLASASVTRQRVLRAAGLDFIAIPSDTDEETIRRRLEVYDRESRPVLSYYPKELRVDVDALQSPIEVAHDILSALLGRTNEIHEVPPVPVMAN